MPWQQKEMSILTEVGSNFRLATIPGAQRNGQFGHLGHKTVKRLEITPTTVFGGEWHHLKLTSC